jgi:uncharacterized membrane protein
MNWLVAILLFLHIMGAIIAFGPTFAFPIIASSATKEPQHLNFALRLQKRVAETLVTPLAIFQGVTGLLLVWAIGFDILKQPWLLLGITLYLIALAISFTQIYPSLRILLEGTATPPPADAPPGGGPPPHIAGAARRMRLASMTNAVLIVVIVILLIGGARGYFLATPLF